jgi:hypothetical protein
MGIYHPHAGSQSVNLPAPGDVLFLSGFGWVALQGIHLQLVELD